MKKLRIRSKIIIASTLLYSLVIITFIIFAFKDTMNFYYKIYDARITPHLQHIENLIKENSYQIENINHESITRHLSDSEEKLTYRIFDKDFNILTPSIPFFQYEDVLEELEEGTMMDVYSTDDEKQHYIFKTEKLRLKNGEIIYLVISSEADEFDSAYLKHRIFFLILIPVFVALITFISFTVSKIAFQPVKRMVNETKKIRAEDLHRRLSVPEPKDEIRELGETLNEMIASIEESFNSQKRFIADASHEIKTPLTIIRTRLEFLSSDLRDEKCREEIKSLLPEIDRLTNLAKSLLTLARLDARSSVGLNKSIRLDELIMDLVQYFQTAAARKQTRIVPQINDVVEIFSDSDKIHSVIFNLIDNAIKYSPEKSRITIELTKSGNCALISVKDNGAGINPTDLPNVFKRFYRSDETRSTVQGSGLGLSIVEEIVKQNNGEIELNSKLGEGTEVVVKLPV